MNLISQRFTPYRGPEHLGNDVEVALDSISANVSFEVTWHEQHSVIRAYGLTDSRDIYEAIAVYLVGSIASCVRNNLEIRAALFGEGTAAYRLHGDVVSLVGANNDISDDYKRTRRNPWIWECMSHLIFHLSDRGHPSHPPDQIVAKTLPSLDVTQHGFDVLAIYGTDSLGVTTGECKAYLDRPADAIRDASNSLEEIDTGDRDARIRQAVNQLSPFLTQQQQSGLVKAFWHDERAYFPMVCCDESAAVDWEVNRRVIERLAPPPERKFLVPLPIEDAECFFDEIAQAMRDYVLKDWEASDV